ncbi:hypothetical protein BDZ91DRAFT_717331 [Kalaharituber pfeilii]|nr:hypothetical protein BDZ91DRAFT_717331 [Kalaharituber pfeilii]
MEQIHIDMPQRGRDLMQSDNFLTDSTLDSLWEWFITANRDKLDLRIIFVKLVNAVRENYRDNLPSYSSDTFSVDPPCYSPRESTITEGLDDVHLQSHHCEEIQELYTKLVTAEHALQAKQRVVDTLDVHIRRLEQQLGAQRSRHSEEMQELGIKLATVEYALQGKQIVIEKLEGCVSKLEKIQHQQYKHNTEEEKSQLVLQARNIIQELQDKKQGVIDERKQWVVHHLLTKEEHERLRYLPHVAIRSAYNSDKYIRISNYEVLVGTTLDSPAIFQLITHRDGTVSFKSTCFANTYLSAEGTYVRQRIASASAQEGEKKLSCANSCSNKEKFRIHSPAEWNLTGITIEPVDFRDHYVIIWQNPERVRLTTSSMKPWQRYHIVVVE